MKVLTDCGRILGTVDDDVPEGIHEYGFRSDGILHVVGIARVEEKEVTQPLQHYEV